MTPTRLSAPRAAGKHRRRRARAGAPEQDVLGGLGGAEQSARQLADDLAALVKAGLLHPVQDGDELRFAVTEPTAPEA